MKYTELLESIAEQVKIIKAVRMMKISLRNGENPLVDLSSLKCEYFALGSEGGQQPWLIYIGKPRSLESGKLYNFENAEKPGFLAFDNMRMKDYKIVTLKVLKTLPEALALLKTMRTKLVIIDPALLKGAPPVTATTADEPANEEDGFFALGYWINAYRPDDKEYFWSGPYRDRKNAVAFGNTKQNRGQPKTFIDWGKGKVTIIRGLDKFKAAAKKVNLNPNVDELYWID